MSVGDEILSDMAEKPVYVVARFAFHDFDPKRDVESLVNVMIFAEADRNGSFLRRYSEEKKYQKRFFSKSLYAVFRTRGEAFDYVATRLAEILGRLTEHRNQFLKAMNNCHELADEARNVVNQ
ncbi:TPA: hypothetical protein JG832_002424 [Enterobacter hormaechei subsp. xiangfangensis]|nr:hypothetical protein [Enterobacter hormaechei subsp. xiangfangensis]HAV1890560.1 hypothetical protein [Enterobacter hormaechei subsp. xiangfangensis]